MPSAKPALHPAKTKAKHGEKLAANDGPADKGDKADKGENKTAALDPDAKAKPIVKGKAKKIRHGKKHASTAKPKAKVAVHKPKKHKKKAPPHGATKPASATVQH